MSNSNFRPGGTIVGDPQRNQQLFLVLQSTTPFEISQVSITSGSQIADPVKTKGTLDHEQRITLFQDTLKKLTAAEPAASEWPVDFAVSCRRLGGESIARYSGVIQKCRKPGILKVTLKPAS